MALILSIFVSLFFSVLLTLLLIPSARRTTADITIRVPECPDCAPAEQIEVKSHDYENNRATILVNRKFKERMVNSGRA